MGCANDDTTTNLRLPQEAHDGLTAAWQRILRRRSSAPVVAVAPRDDRHALLDRPPAALHDDGFEAGA